MKPREKLTPRELAIMQVVWKRGDATVRDVHEALSRERKVAYTTVMTLMNILATKGHLVRRQDDRAYVYSPARPRQQVVGRLVRDFVDRVFSGSAQPLLLHLVRHEKLTAADRAELKRIIDTLED
jgi:predicted transcriptional regulator